MTGNALKFQFLGVQKMIELNGLADSIRTSVPHRSHNARQEKKAHNDEEWNQ